MQLFRPTLALNRVTDITPNLLRAFKVEAVLLDVDNTLAFPDSQTPFPGTVEWSQRLQKNGIQMIIMSNNFPSRVRPFAEKYRLPFLSVAMKPLPMAYRRAARQLGVGRKQAIVVGDQVFTDVLGANLARMKSVLLMPPAEEDSISFRIRRRLERPIRRRAIEEKRIRHEKEDGR